MGRDCCSGPCVRLVSNHFFDILERYAALSLRQFPSDSALQNRHLPALSLYVTNPWAMCLLSVSETLISMNTVDLPRCLT